MAPKETLSPISLFKTAKEIIQIRLPFTKHMDKWFFYYILYCISYLVKDTIFTCYVQNVKIGSLTHRLYKSFNVCIRNYQSNICKVLWYFVTTLGKPIIIACNHWWSENTILELVWFKGVRIEKRHISTYYTRKEILKAQGQSLISYTPGNGHLLLNCPSHWEISSLIYVALMKLITCYIWQGSIREAKPLWQIRYIKRWIRDVTLHNWWSRLKSLCETILPSSGTRA